MNGRYLLDSNIVIALLSGDQSVIDQIDQASEIFLPSIGIGELYYGAFNSSKKQTNVDRIDQLRSQVTVLDCDDFTAKFYGQIKKALKDKGTPIPENDIWIGAIAMQYELTVATRDNHFLNIEGLGVDKW
ncbi:MAG: type II toxin-antitoxin system VapC family toxin [Saprospiraceae bacterium]|nr:type II toxin-antitoxin system VapC family toxin [Saprospiraceae bacterium]MCB0625335.1 type II toxin-antitoxin system VapC family toxin [Saprospiraceae bacterium]MCB0677952.1 type II toxin-antitoxin system VapC family toxin [Saprospiraceae bacterium]MCB0679568.1 type II toxin-antitoxin system VapC family toxin [Saprospiraceae bacterium]